MKPETSPVYLLAGSPGSRNRSGELLRLVLSGAGAKPSVAYIGTASNDDPGFFAFIRELLAAAGAGPVTLAPLSGRQADARAARNIIGAADLVFVSGGDVEAGLRRLEEQSMVGFLRQVQAGGVPFVGVSAGSIMLARAWVRWSDPDDDASASRLDGLGFAPVYCDTHAEGEGWEELKSLLRLCEDEAIGYGIPSGGGLGVRPDGSVAALGLPVRRFVRRGGRIRALGDLKVTKR